MTAPLVGPGMRPGGVASILERGLGSPLGEANGGTPFGDLLKRAIGDVVEVQQHKEDMIGAFLRGDPVELHDVMAAAEEASLSLELLVETRNKLTDAYRSVMNMQV